MATGKGVVQGYAGVAAVDEKHQIIVEAQAHGTGSEQELLVPVAQAIQPQMNEQTVLSADAVYHSEDGLKTLAAASIDAYIPDNNYRKRDPRYARQGAHKGKPDPLWDKRSKIPKPTLFKPADFQFDPEAKTCVCPAGKPLYSNGSNCTFNDYSAMKFRGAERDCVPCPLRAQCLRTPEKTKTRQVALFQGKRGPEKPDGPDEGQNRQPARQSHDYPPFRHGRTGIWQSQKQQAPRPLYLARPHKSRRTMVAVLSRP